MSNHEDSGQSAEAQLRHALGGVARIVDDILRRNREIGEALRQTQERQRAEGERVAAMERALSADHASLEQMSTVFSSVAGPREASPAAAPLIAPEPGPLTDGVPAQGTVSQSSATALVAEAQIDQEHRQADAIDPRRSALTVADFLALQGKREQP